MMHIPTLNFNDSSLYQTPGLGDGTSPLLTRLTSATVSNVAILPMQAVAPNITYHHEFLGPSLKCDTTTGERLANMDTIWNLTRRSIHGLAGNELMYLAYTMTEDDPLNPSSTPFNFSDFVSGCVTGGPCGCSGCPISVRVYNESVTCVMLDTHFDLDIRSVGDTQSITGLSWQWFSESDVNNRPVYSILSQALATILNGAIGAGGSGPFQGDGFSLTTYQTRVMSTALIGTIGSAFNYLLPLPRADQEMAANRTLAQMIEELSRNQTLSLFNSEVLW